MVEKRPYTETKNKILPKVLLQWILLQYNLASECKRTFLAVSKTRREKKVECTKELLLGNHPIDFSLN